ncbi:MAG: matrixin family metalloprotease [Acidobacteria bacterium]|nr:matrixin family metalloprotease [Acidobacteriota bacterium]
MKYPVRLVLILFILISSAANIASYVRTTVSLGIGASIQWNLNNPDTRIVSNGRITYNINSAGSDNLPFSDVENAIMASFQTWEDVPTSSVAFARGPNTSSTSTAYDGQLQIFWIEDSTSTIDGLNLAGVLAISRLTNYTSGLRTGEILDASLIFNGKEFNWSVNGATNSADIQDIATHEIGHIIGLGHSPIGGATMFPRSLIGSKLVRSLAEDDRIAVSAAYPVSGFLNSTGTLRGRVRDNTGRNIFGAHIVALNTDGIAVSGALSFDDGTYTVQGLPPDPIRSMPSRWILYPALTVQNTMCRVISRRFSPIFRRVRIVRFFFRPAA